MRTSTRMTLAAGIATALGAVPIGAVFTEWRWVWYAWAAIAAVVGGHLLARSLRFPGFLVPFVGAAALVEYLVVVFAGDTALAGLVPNRAALRSLQDGLDSGLNDVDKLAAPVQATPGLVVLAAVGLGVMALLIDVIAVSLRRPAAAGLALLAMYAVPTAVALDGVPWLLFVVGAAGYLVLLLAEGRERLLRWGRPVAGPAADGARSDTGVPFTGQRIGIAALALAVVLPLLVPGLSTNALSDLGRTGNGDGTGTGSGTSQNPFVSLKGELDRSDPQDLLRVQLPAGTRSYLRTNVLENVSDDGWAQGSRGQSRTLITATPLNAPSGQVAQPDDRSFNAKITVLRYNGVYLPLYYYPTSVQPERLDGRWVYDQRLGTAYSRGNRVGEFVYTEQVTLPAPSPAELRQSPALDDAQKREMSLWLGLGTLSDQAQRRLQTEIGRAVGGVAQTPYDQARAVSDYFTSGKNGYTYSLQTEAGSSGSALIDFVDNKQGYCEQYAATMGVMLRMLGIPARVVLGYTDGTLDDNKPTRTITTNDAHAWVEAYFEGYGWMWFDPTPLSGTRAVDPPYAPNPSRSATPTATASAGAAPPSASSTGQSRLDPNDTEQSTDTADQSGGSGPVDLRLVLGGLVGVALIAALVSPAVARTVTRRRRLRAAAGPDPVAAARAAWDEVLAEAVDHGVEVPGTETPRATAGRLTRQVATPAAAAGVRLIALAEERARYAPSAGVEGDLPTAVRAVGKGISGQVDGRRRWQARLLPASTLRAARTGSSARAASASTAASRLGEALRLPLSFGRRRRG